MKIALVLAVVLAPLVARADHTTYISRALAAVHSLGASGRDQLERDVHAAARTRCHAEASRPAPSCLAEAAAARCHGDANCEAAADVVATNTRAANDWIDETTRAQLVRSSTDYRAALAAELQKRFAALAAELALVAPVGDAAAIDRLCRERDRTVHACRDGDTACIPSIPWSRCAAALVWFVGASS